MKALASVTGFRKNECHACRFLDDQGGISAFCILFVTRGRNNTVLSTSVDGTKVFRCKRCLKTEVKK